ncbi:hypothetical protein QJS10_CPA01g01063 [Acorus calamus]|uniref:MORF/ORRM1/DAG-like MORF domain-containing protein n=1 Tax=Acorus calamus TaxID=4465 RepID=A0AAV9FG14_ACOCL|nr:hypothetical protein QJS10_CPA01g01063 [Acorus calamus]
MATLNTSSLTIGTLNPRRPQQSLSVLRLPLFCLSRLRPSCPSTSSLDLRRRTVMRAVVDGNYSTRRGSSGSGNGEPREKILLPGCDYNHWLIVMEFPKDPAPTREQMIETYLDTLATVLGSLEVAKKNMYAFSTTTYTGCTVDEETSEKFKDSYIDVKNKDYGGDKYINGEIIPCTYLTYQPKQRGGSKYESRRYERRRDGPPAERRKPRQDASQATPASS